MDQHVPASESRVRLMPYVIQSDRGLRVWQAEEADHAVEQHRDAADRPEWAR